MAVRGPPRGRPAAHGGASGSSGRRAGLRVPEGRVRARQSVPELGVGWWPRGGVAAALRFLDSVDGAWRPVSPAARPPAAPRWRPALTAPRTSTRTHVGRAVVTSSAPDLPGESETGYPLRLGCGGPAGQWPRHLRVGGGGGGRSPSSTKWAALPRPALGVPAGPRWMGAGTVTVRSHNLPGFSEVSFPPRVKGKRQGRQLSLN